MPSAFLSYGRGDEADPFAPATSFVARLHRDLTAHGLKIWFDRVSMPSRSLTFHQEIIDAITAHERLVLVVGPKTVTSAYVRQEWQFAYFEAEKVVTPILRLGDYDLVPGELKLLHCEDFRDDAEYEFHLKNLVRQLSEPAPPLGKLIAVPSLPDHFLSRTERLTALRDAVRADLDRPVVISGASARVGVHGMGGIGKSVLASAVSHDRKVREAFPDGIVWVPVGSHPALADLQRQVHKDLGGDGAFATEHEGRSKLKDLLADKRVLLILDDVWQRTDADAFDVLGPRCRAMITTRDAGLLTSLGGTHHVLELLTDQEALNILAQATGLERENLPSQAAAVIAECGRLPLAVALCGGMVKRGVAWVGLPERLREAFLEGISDRHAPEGHHRSVWATMKVSVDALTEDERRRFIELCVFPNDEAVPEAAVRTLWSHTGKLNKFHCEDLLISLSERSLVQLSKSSIPAGGEAIRLVSLHDLLHDFATRLAEDTQPLHNQILEAYRKLCREGWPSGPNDGYFFTHLCHHLAQAGRFEELGDLLGDLDFVEAKVRVGMIHHLVSDYNVAMASDRLAPGVRGACREFAGFVRAQAHVLARRPALTLAQAANEPDATAPARAARQRFQTQAAPSPWLRWINKPQTPSPCLTVLTGHTADLVACDVWTDEQGGVRILSASEDRTLKVWDAATGATVLTLHNTAVLLACAAPRDGVRIASGDTDGNLKLWDARTGELLVTLHHGKDSVDSCCFTRDGKRLLSSSYDQTLCIWDVASGQELGRLSGHGCLALACAFSADGRWIVSGDVKGRLMVWDAHTCQHRQTLPAHASEVMSCCFSPDGRWLFSASFDHTFKRWDFRPGGTLDTEPMTFAGHDDTVWACSVSPDQSLVASASIDKTLKLWEPRTGRDLATLSGHARDVMSCAFLPNGKRLVSASWDGTLRLWDVAAALAGASVVEPAITLPVQAAAAPAADSGSQRPAGFLRQLTSRLRRILPAASPVTSAGTDSARPGDSGQTVSQPADQHGDMKYWLTCAIAPDGSRLVAGSEVDLRLWDARTGMELATLRGHGDLIYHCTFSPDGSWILSTSRDGTLRRWDAQRGQQLAVFQGHEGIVRAAYISPDGSQILSCSDDGTLRLWDVATGQIMVTLTADYKPVRTLAVAPNWNWAVAGDSLGKLRYWNLTTRTEGQPFAGHQQQIGCCAISPDGQRLVSGDADGGLRVWDIATRRALAVLAGHKSEIRDCAFAPHGGLIASASADHTIKLWDIPSLSLRSTLRGHDAYVCSVAFVPPGGTRLLSAAYDGTLRLWDIDAGAQAAVVVGARDAVRSCDYAPGGTQVVSASHRRRLKLWDGATGTQERVLGGHRGEVRACAFSPDGTQVVSASADGTLRLWDTRTGALRAVLTGHGGPVQSCVFSPDGRLLLSGSWDRTLKLWSVRTGALQATLTGHQDWVQLVRFSPDGRSLASCSLDRTVRLWDAITGKEQATLIGHQGAVGACDFSPDGSRLLSASGDATIRVWDAATGKALATLARHTAAVTCCRFTPNSRQAVSGSMDGSLRIWDTRTGTELAMLVGHESWVLCCAFAPDASKLLSGAGDSFVKLWNVTPATLCCEFCAGAAVHTVAWHPSGTRLAAGDAEGRVHLLNVEAMAK